MYQRHGLKFSAKATHLETSLVQSKSFCCFSRRGFDFDRSPGPRFPRMSFSSFNSTLIISRFNVNEQRRQCFLAAWSANTGYLSHGIDFVPRIIQICIGHRISSGHWRDTVFGTSLLHNIVLLRGKLIVDPPRHFLRFSA